ncbi:lipid A deacylase LpxR family protein [Alcanivorax sp.]|uniref:lipid A deacylase LpxR family protein n=1 Tax=Alcanivorax sp. TaxID=1872427 RepID=UPI0025BB2D2F|nr:lipid A deacylase LpxR family protein [Alcanivorax sp.]
MTENTRDSLFPSPGFRVASLLAIIMLASPGLTAAASLSDTASPLARAGDPGFAEMRPRQSRPQPQQERETGSWALTLDNDMLVPGTRDQDYTYGLSMAATGTRARDFLLSLDTPLGWIDTALGLNSLSGSRVRGHSFEAGIFGFTPEQKERPEPLYDDRPYASMIYLSSSRVQVNPDDQVAWHSTLTLGALGLDLAGNIQNGVHKVVGSEQAEGWDHQISDGGEPTARYAVARQKTLPISSDNLEVKSTVEGSVGYLTEARWSLSFRAGRLRSPWWQSNPELTRYGERNNTTATSEDNEHYVWGGIALVGRAYNAFLQGQFRDSDVRYDSDEVNHGVAEAWLGYTYAFSDGYRLSYVLRGHTSELKEGVGDRNVLWGGLVFAKTFD